MCHATRLIKIISHCVLRSFNCVQVKYAQKMSLHLVVQVSSFGQTERQDVMFSMVTAEHVQANDTLVSNITQEAMRHLVSMTK